MKLLVVLQYKPIRYHPGSLSHHFNYSSHVQATATSHTISPATPTRSIHPWLIPYYEDEPIVARVLQSSFPPLASCRVCCGPPTSPATMPTTFQGSLSIP